MPEQKFYKMKHILIHLQMWRMGILKQAHSVLNFCYKTAKSPVTPSKKKKISKNKKNKI